MTTAPDWEELNALVDGELTSGHALEVEARVKKIIAEQLGVEESQVTNAKAFVADLGADSRLL